MVKIFLFICASICFVQSQKTDGFLRDKVLDSEGNPKQDGETCNIQGSDYVGLTPGEDCSVFWLCRKSASPNNTVEAVQFRCDDDEADPTKKYYDAEKCECVSTDTHCANNYQAKNSCIRVLKGGEADEDCRGFGGKGGFYEGHFVNFVDPHIFWFCHPDEVSSDSKAHITKAIEYPCPSDLQYNMQNCTCDYSYNVFLPFNQHPMNRFKCAVPLVVPEDRETCQDEQKRYYEGYFVYAEDPQWFWECSVNNDSMTSASLMSVSQAKLQRCDSDTYFHIETCECSTERPENNSSAENRYNCATLLDVEEDIDPCKDSDGLYHIGDIPDITDCSKFLSCVTTSDPVKTAPIQRHCHSGQFFNVLSSFNGHCGCDRPENFKCEDNHIPQNKFLCARETTTTTSEPVQGNGYSQS